tara:strand:- start:3899 stop:5299 length:1401 start_codon:yes stop_codon:yes gene_type:complete
MTEVLDRYFKLKESNSTVRREVLAGATTFVTMAYIIFVQPAVLSGKMFGFETGMDFGAVMTATCLGAAIASAIMGIYARYPIAQAPGMGQNFFFALTAIPAATAAGFSNAWETALGVVFVSGVLFLLVSSFKIRETLLNALSPSMKHGIAVGIGLFIAFIGLQNAGLIVKSPATGVTLNHHFLSPDLMVFFVGVIVAVSLHARRIPGSVLLGIMAATVLACILKVAGASDVYPESKLATMFQFASGVFATPPSISPALFKMDLSNALSTAMLPFVLVFLFMVLFDTVGTLVGVSEQAGLIEGNELPRARQAFTSDALGTTIGACLGTSTVTAYIESAAGVEQGGRTGLTAVTVAILFLLALFLSPIVAMIGGYPPLTAPALVLVGAMMFKGVGKIDWSDFTEAFPAFVVMVGIPFSYSIGDGLALGILSYSVVKLLSGRHKDVHWVVHLLASVLLLYFAFVRSKVG